MGTECIVHLTVNRICNICIRCIKSNSSIWVQNCTVKSVEFLNSSKYKLNFLNNEVQNIYFFHTHGIQ